jgi:hypothetical protein
MSAGTEVEAVFMLAVGLVLIVGMVMICTERKR